MIVRKNSPVAAGLSRAGLSLLEVLVSLAIFLMSLVALGQLISQGGDFARDVQWMKRASMLAESRIAELTAGSLPLNAQAETPCDEDPDFSWAVDTETDNTPGLYRVTVTISRQRTDGSRFELQLNQMILDPLMRGTTDGAPADGSAAATTSPTTTPAPTTGGGS